MIRVIVYFDNEALDSKPIELVGLAKRINSIGLQPIPGDLFCYDDLSKADKCTVENTVKSPIKNLIVKSRQFRFENTYSAIYVQLSPN